MKTLPWESGVRGSMESENGGAVPELLAADCVMHGISETGGTFAGPKSFWPCTPKLLSAFPDMQFALDDCLAPATNCGCVGLPRCGIPGRARNRPRTGAEIKLRGMGIARIAGAKCRKPGITGTAWRCSSRLTRLVKAKSAGA